MKVTATRAALIALAIGTAPALAACGGDDEEGAEETVTVTEPPAEDTQTDATQPQADDGAEDDADPGDGQQGEGDTASRADVERLARREAQGGRIEEIERDDGGWEVEVRRPNGTEVELRLDARGRVLDREIDD